MIIERTRLAIATNSSINSEQSRFTLETHLIDRDSDRDSFPIENVVQLRESMENERRLSVSEHLVEATILVSDNPWSPSLRTELERIAERQVSDRPYQIPSRPPMRRAERLSSARATETSNGLQRALATIGGATTAWTNRKRCSRRYALACSPRSALIGAAAAIPLLDNS